MVNHPNRNKANFRLTAWQIAALEKLIRDELARRADNGDEATPWVCGVQSLAATFDGALGVTVTKNKKR